MLNPPTSFQLSAKDNLDALAARYGLTFVWAQELGDLYVRELMIVGRIINPRVTVWLYDDGLDYELGQAEVANFEAQNFKSQEALLSMALTELQVQLDKHSFSPNDPRV